MTPASIAEVEGTGSSAVGYRRTPAPRLSTPQALRCAKASFSIYRSSSRSLPSSAGAQNPAPAPAAAPTGFATIHGTVIDSLHDALLAHALVRVDNSTREAITDSTGRLSHRQRTRWDAPAGRHSSAARHARHLARDAPDHAQCGRDKGSRSRRSRRVRRSCR